MIVAIGHRFDREVAAWCRRSAHDVRLLRIDDVLRTGWRHDVPDAGTGRAVVSGATVDTRTVRAVVSFADGFVADELFELHPADRGYAAGETSAFLRAWLLSLGCPMFPRPSAQGFRGLSPELVLRRAAALGIDTRVRSLTTSVETGPVHGAPAAASSAHIVGRACLTSGAPEGLAREVACAMDVTFGQLWFAQDAGRWRLCGYAPAIELARADVAAALDDLIAEVAA